MDGRSDEALVRAVRLGEIGAFDELYRRYSSRLFSFLLRLVRDRAEAEDLLQEVFLTVLRDDALELRDGKVAAWLFTVARNRAIGRLRQQKREAAHADREDEPAPPASPEAKAEIRLRFEQVEKALAALSDDHQEVLLLKVVGGLTYAQIAEVQAVPEGTAKSRMHFAVRAVRKFFSGKGIDDEP